MKKDIKNIFTGQVQELLTEDTLNALEKTIKDKINLNVEAALIKQDDLYSKKLVQLLEAQDKSYTTKIAQIIRKIDENTTKKLRNVIRKADRMITKEAASFKDEIISSVSDYLDLYLENAVPKKDIEQATKNKTALHVLENLRKVLAVDSVLMKGSVKEAVMEGKQRLDDAQSTNNKLTKENAAIKQAYNRLQTELFLERKTIDMPEKKREFLQKALSDKSFSFIKENFDYTAKLFDKKETDRLETLKEEAFAKRKVKTDTVIIKENSETVNNNNLNPLTSSYLNELRRVR